MVSVIYERASGAARRTAVRRRDPFDPGPQLAMLRPPLVRDSGLLREKGRSAPVADAVRTVCPIVGAGQALMLPRAQDIDVDPYP